MVTNNTVMFICVSYFICQDNFQDLADNPTTDPTTLYNNFVLIAEGESGPLYSANHISTNRQVAIKKIPKTASVKLSKIKNELVTMKMSRHPNVVEYITSYVTKEEIWVNISTNTMMHLSKKILGRHGIHGYCFIRYFVTGNRR